jgi:hypoxanthine phosphoribosyltransferase
MEHYSKLDDLLKPKKEKFSYNSSLENLIKPLYSNNSKYIEREEIFSKDYGTLYEIILPKEPKFDKKIRDPFSQFGLTAIDIDFGKLLKTPSYAFVGAQLPELLKEIESQRDPRKFKEAVLEGIQLYFDGLVEGRNELPNPEVWAEQLEALNAMLNGVGMTVAAFYRQNQEIPFDEVREAIMPYDSKLIRHGSQNGCKNRHLAGSEHQVGSYAVNVVNALDGEDVDLVIPVASGGFEPAFLTADYLGVNQLFPIRYSRVSRTDSRVLVPTQAPADYPMQQISGNRILLVDDIVASGATASKLAQWVKNYDPAKVYFAVVQGGGKDLGNSGFHSHQSSQHLYKHEREAVLTR